MDLLRWLSPSKEPATPKPPPFRFLDLPAELRIMTYKEVINSGASLRRDYTSSTSTTLNPQKPPSLITCGSLTRVNRQLHNELTHALTLTPPPILRIHIRDADFSPLWSFCKIIRKRRWRRYLGGGRQTQIRAVAHYDPRSYEEAEEWGAEVAEAIWENHHRVKFNFEIVIRESIFKQHQPAAPEEGEDGKENIHPSLPYALHLKHLQQLQYIEDPGPGMHRDYEVRDFYQRVETAMRRKAHERQRFMSSCLAVNQSGLMRWTFLGFGAFLLERFCVDLGGWLSGLTTPTRLWPSKPAGL